MLYDVDEPLVVIEPTSDSVPVAADVLDFWNSTSCVMPDPTTLACAHPLELLLKNTAPGLVEFCWQNKFHPAAGLVVPTPIVPVNVFSPDTVCAVSVVCAVDGRRLAFNVPLEILPALRDVNDAPEPEKPVAVIVPEAIVTAELFASSVPSVFPNVAIAPLVELAGPTTLPAPDAELSAFVAIAIARLLNSVSISVPLTILPGLPVGSESLAAKSVDLV